MITTFWLMEHWKKIAVALLVALALYFGVKWFLA